MRESSLPYHSQLRIPPDGDSQLLRNFVVLTTHEGILARDLVDRELQFPIDRSDDGKVSPPQSISSSIVLDPSREELNTSARSLCRSAKRQ